MNKFLKPFYYLYQAVFAMPVFFLITVYTAFFTLFTTKWKNSDFVHRTQQFWAKSYLKLAFLPVTVEGTEKLDMKQSYVFVSNHQSTTDVFLIYGWLPSVFKWIMKQELRKVPFIGCGCAAAGHIFIERQNKRHALESIGNAEQVLHDGVCVVVFPEGTRSTNGQVGRFKRGAFHIAQELQLPIVPISLSGCYETVPKGKLFVRWHPVKMYIGDPIDSTKYPKEQMDELIALTREKVIEHIEKL